MNLTPNKNQRPTRSRRFIRTDDCKSFSNRNTVANRPKKELNFVTLDSKSQGRVYNPERVDMSLPHKAISCNTSNRWLRSLKGPSPAVDLPYIDKVGKYTGTTLYRASISPQGFISTVVSTIYRRMRRYIARFNPIHQCNINQSLLLKCAGYYAISKNNYFMDRILVLFKNVKDNQKSIKKILHRFCHKLDDNKWFVYGHVCLQTQWLTFRARKPRDKSSFNKSESNFTLPTSIRGGQSEIARFTYDAIWSCFSSMHLI